MCARRHTEIAEGVQLIGMIWERWYDGNPRDFGGRRTLALKAPRFGDRQPTPQTCCGEHLLRYGPERPETSQSQGVSMIDGFFQSHLPEDGAMTFDCGYQSRRPEEV
mgnify:CR=1 FL=1